MLSLYLPLVVLIVCMINKESIFNIQKTLMFETVFKSNFFLYPDSDLPKPTCKKVHWAHLNLEMVFSSVFNPNFCSSPIRLVRPLPECWGVLQPLPELSRAGATSPWGLEGVLQPPLMARGGGATSSSGLGVVVWPHPKGSGEWCNLPWRLGGGGATSPRRLEVTPGTHIEKMSNSQSGGL